MTADIIQFPKRGAFAVESPAVQFSSEDNQTDVVCDASEPRWAVLGKSQMSRAWTDDELDGVKIDVGMYWDTFKFEVCQSSPLHAKLCSLLEQP